VKQKEFIKIGRQLLPHLSGFVVNKDVVFQSPVDDFLRGLCFQGSSDANSFYLWVFIIPLFVLHDSLGFSHGKRLRNQGNEGWYADDPNLIANLADAIQREAIPFLNNASTLEKFANYLKADIDSARPRVNSYVLETLTYSLIKNGDYFSAPKLFAEVKQRLEKSTVPWDVEHRTRTELIEEKLLQNPEAALQQLEIWKAETIRNLKLEKFC
jgi:hypothetical protein